MKNLNDNQQTQKTQTTEVDFKPSFQMEVYNEMSDSTAQSVDVIQMIEQQFLDLNHMATKRNFLLKEISSYMKSV
jgi:hypothetical protein